MRVRGLLVLAVAIAVGWAAATPPEAVATHTCFLNPAHIDCAPPPNGCPQINSGVDGNPTNAAIPPRLGGRLIPKRPDGHLPVGFNDQSTFVAPSYVTHARNAQLHTRAGSTLIRYTVEWPQVEATKDVIQFPAKYDRIYCSALAAGIKPVINLSFSPRWSLETGDVCWAGTAPASPTATVCRNPPSAANEAELESFAEAVVQRYPQAVAVEAWNEPNLTQFWRQPDAVRYASVLGAIYRGVKNRDPSMPVIGGSLSNNQTTTVGGNVSIYDFLEGIYLAGGGTTMDAVGVHPYPHNVATPDLFAQTMNGSPPSIPRGVREIVEDHDGVGQRRIWINETGASNTQSFDSAALTPAQQSQALLSVYSRAEAMAEVDAVIFHTVVERRDTAAAKFHEWVYKDELERFMPKQVYCDFAALLGQPTNCSQPIS